MRIRRDVTFTATVSHKSATVLLEQLEGIKLQITLQLLLSAQICCYISCTIYSAQSTEHSAQYTVNSEQ